MKNLLYTVVFISILSSCAQYKPVAAPAYDTDYSYAEVAQTQSTARFDFESGSRVDANKLAAQRLFQDSVDQGTGERLVVRSAQMNMEVKESEPANDSLRWIANRFGGYVVRSSTYGSQIRVNHDKLDEAVDAISKLGKVHSKTFKGSDETIAYYDMGIRLENANKARERYLGLLASANSIQEALLVEHELERLNQEIDLLNGRRRGIKRLAIHATISVDYEREKLNEKKPGILGYVFIGMYKGVKWLFVRG